MRNDYAWEKLTVRQVSLYNNLPRAIGDLWVDTGAKVSELLDGQDAERNWTIRQIEEVERRDDKKGRLHFSHWESLAQTGLVEVLRCQPVSEYQSFKALIKKIEAWGEYERRWSYNGVEGRRLRPYTRHFFLGAWPVRELRLMDDALEYLIDTTRTPAGFRLSPAEFEPLVKEARTAGEFKDLLKAAILNKGLSIPDRPWTAREKLKQAEIDSAALDYIERSRWTRRQNMRFGEPAAVRTSSGRLRKAARLGSRRL